MNTRQITKTYFPRTTASQRKLLFQTWQTTGDIQLACRKAHVCERTFYNWKPRFESAGLQALEQFASHAPKTPHRTSQVVEQKVIDLRRRHPKWGKRRIADEIAKDNNWVPLVSPNTVRRILIDARLWSQIATLSDSKKPLRARTADKPAQTLNIDLCFVPATHETNDVVSKLPAVSGSSGRLVVERTLDQAAVDSPTWPGRVFEQQELTYEQAMDTFVHASTNKSSLPPTAKSPEALAAAQVLEQKRQLRQEEEALRIQRRSLRLQRKLEDEAWSTIRDRRRAQQAKPSKHQATKATQQTTLLIEGTQQVTEGTQQVTEATQQVTEATQQVTEATQQATETTQQATEATEATQQATEVTQSATEATQQATEVTQQATEVTQSATEVTQSATEVTQSATEVTQSATEATQQTTLLIESTQQTIENTQQATEAPQQTTGVREVGLASEAVVEGCQQLEQPAEQANSVVQ